MNPFQTLPDLFQICCISVRFLNNTHFCSYGAYTDVFYMSAPSEGFKNGLEITKLQNFISDMCSVPIDFSGGFQGGIDHRVRNIYLGTLRKMNSSEWMLIFSLTTTKS